MDGRNPPTRPRKPRLLRMLQTPPTASESRFMNTAPTVGPGKSSGHCRVHVRDPEKLRRECRVSRHSFLNVCRRSNSADQRRHTPLGVRGRSIKTRTLLSNVSDGACTDKQSRTMRKATHSHPCEGTRGGLRAVGKRGGGAERRTKGIVLNIHGCRGFQGYSAASLRTADTLRYPLHTFCGPATPHDDYHLQADLL